MFIWQKPPNNKQNILIDLVFTFSPGINVSIQNYKPPKWYFEWKRMSALLLKHNQKSYVTATASILKLQFKMLSADIEFHSHTTFILLND